MRPLSRDPLATIVLMALLGLVMLAIAMVVPASAEEDLGVWLSREDAARVFGEAAKVPALVGQVKALEAEAAELRAGRDAALKVVEITGKIGAAQERLRQLAEEERDAWQDKAERQHKAERQEKDRGKGKLWLTIQARGAVGALLGTPFGLPGIGIGAVAGGIAGAVEAWVGE